MASTVVTYTTTTSWICPPGVTSVQAECWGGGGGGGGALTLTTTTGGGGGGGEYAKETSVAVAAGTSYTATIGAGGTAGSGSTKGVAGGNSSFAGTSLTVTAHGGGVGSEGGAGAAGAGGTGSANTTHFNGGGGKAGVSNSFGGGGGGSGGTASVGTTATTATGAAAVTGGGNGGNGASAVGNGSSPTGTPGGGGGGARGGTSTRSGGVGAAGQVTLTYTTPTASNLTDTFGNGSMNTSLWTGLNSSQVTWTGGSMNISNVASSTAYGGIRSSATYDMTNSAVAVQLTNAGNQSIASWQCVFLLSQATNTTVQYIVNGGNLSVQKDIGGTYSNLSSTTYNATTMQWLRIREASSTTYFDYSADGVNWTNFYSVADVITMSAVTIELECGTYNSETSTTTGSWQNLNVLPLLLTNNFEGGTSGTTITTANSGGTSGTAFNNVVIGTTASAAFSNAQAAHGGLSLAVATGTTNSDAYVQWGSTTVGTQTTLYGRIYVYLTAAPGTSDAFIEFQNSGSWMGAIQITTARQWLIQDEAFATVHTTTNTIPTGQWVRLEWGMTFSATVGQITLNYYATKDSVTATETYTSPATQNFGASYNAIGFGWNNNHISQPTTYIDDIGLSSIGFLGPVATTTVNSGAFMVFFA